MKEILHATKTILMKDIKTELRSPAFIGNSFMFALLVIIIFNFAFTITSENRAALSSGILWISFLFSGTLGLGRCFQVEKENHCIHGISLTPVDRTAIFWAKMAGNMIFLITIQVIIIPIFIILYNINVMENFFAMCSVFLLGDIGFMTLGTLVSAMAVNLKAREILLPVLLLPLLVPLIIFASSATNTLITGGDIAIYFSRIKLMGTFDIIFFVVASLVFEYILDES